MKISVIIHKANKEYEKDSQLFYDREPHTVVTRATVKQYAKANLQIAHEEITSQTIQLETEAIIKSSMEKAAYLDLSDNRRKKVEKLLFEQGYNEKVLGVIVRA